jgi:hypothetical protein
MIAKEIREAAALHNLAVKGSLHALTTFDFTPGYELDRRLKSDPKLLAEFKKNPAQVEKREVGLVVPDGWHSHFINENNEYFPPEGDAVSQLASGKSGKVWSRIEIRMAAGPGCYALCVLCA